MLLLAAIALSAAAPGNADWREFDRRVRGWGETPTEYDAARVERRGPRIRAWTRSVFMLSGLPGIQTRVRIEIDCAGRRSRALETVEEPPLFVRHAGGPRHGWLHQRLAPIAAGSVDEALARRLCPED